ncbi:anti-sigma factor domain-containing protein [Flavobacterium sp.]|uniref:anti-sigma factor domain-containing protein n=1 Tax=Flavobacterium sp. TaxID=239 RepID=UPI0039E3047B
MDIQGYIDTGILELYVYGLLDENGNREVNDMAKQFPEINNEIISIERAIIDLSTSFSPLLSAENFDKIRQRLEIKYGVVNIRTRSYFPKYIGWAAAVLLLAAIGVQYVRLSEAGEKVAVAEIEKTKLQEALVSAEIKTKQSEDALALVRDKNTSIITLGGQAVSPQSYAKVYYNKATQVVYVDAKGLPDPPQGKVYQIWALKLNPLTPTSIGLLENFAADGQRVLPWTKPLRLKVSESRSNRPAEVHRLRWNNCTLWEKYKSDLTI